MGRLSNLTDPAVDRLYSLVGRHSYGHNASAADVLDHVQGYNPPDDGTRREDYVQEVERLLEERVEALDAVPDHAPGRYAAAFRYQLDEASYVGEKIGVGVGGIGSFTTGQPVGYVIGAMMLLSIPPVKSNLREIQRFKEDMEAQQRYYEDALATVEKEGADALNDRINQKIHLPWLGTRHIKMEAQGGVYRRVNDDEY